MTGGIGPDEAHVWSASVQRLHADGMLPRFAALCCEEEHARRTSFVFERDRRSFVAAHGLVRLALSWCEPSVPPTSWRFGRGRYGRPEVASPEGGMRLRFNLSHCEDWVACVVTRRMDCGIDVERIHRSNDLTALAAHTLTPDEIRELELIAAELRPSCVIERWTLKEALAKALGLGLSLAFDTIGFVVRPSGIRLVIPGGSVTRDPERWVFEQWVPDGAHAAALAVRGGQQGVRIVHHGLDGRALDDEAVRRHRPSR